MKPMPPSTPARILVVDDEQAACTALAKFLVAEAFDVTTASDGEAALTEAKRELPDLVITDLTMRRMGGIELCGHIHALDPELPVLVITANPDTSSAVASLRAGADDYLTKPVDLDALLHRIERTLERRRAKNEVTRLREEMRSVNERLVLSSIREQQNAEAADRARTQLNSLLENLSDGVLIADREGRILMTNRAAHEMWLSERVVDDVRQLDSLQMLRVDGAVCPFEERPLTRALRGEMVDRSELLCVRGDAETRRLLMSGTNVRDPAGNVDLAIVVFSDVTDLRRLERQRDEY
ncbi:MAG: response regulator, partial [Polyangiaceae bacterium]